MPRHAGSTRKLPRRKNMGHRVHRRARLTRIKARAGAGRLRRRAGWSPSMRYDDSLGKWVL